LAEDVGNTFEGHFLEGTKIDFGTHANDFMKKLTDEHCIVKLLKASCSQVIFVIDSHSRAEGIVSPAWVKLKLELLEGVSFKDVKLGWKVYVLFSETFVSIVHSVRQLLGGLFTFRKKNRAKFRRIPPRIHPLFSLLGNCKWFSIGLSRI
jgi:hypothetical protein